jgi:hypothetical protein
MKKKNHAGSEKPLPTLTNFILLFVQADMVGAPIIIVGV